MELWKVSQTRRYAPCKIDLKRDVISSPQPAHPEGYRTETTAAATLIQDEHDDGSIHEDRPGFKSRKQTFLHTTQALYAEQKKSDPHNEHSVTSPKISPQTIP